MGNYDTHLVGVGSHDSCQRCERLPYVLAGQLADRGELGRAQALSWRTQLRPFYFTDSVFAPLNISSVDLPYRHARV